MHTYFALSLFLANDSAYAQGPTATRPRLPIDPLGLNDKTIAGTKAAPPAADSAAPLPCDFRMVIKLTPDNLVPAFKACLSDGDSTLANDTGRALKSAQDYNKKWLRLVAGVVTALMAIGGGVTREPPSAPTPRRLATYPDEGHAAFLTARLRNFSPL